MPFDAFQNNVWTIACSWTENFLPIQTDPAGRGKNGRCLPAAVVVLGGGNACYDFGEKRVATVTLLTITTLPGRRSCGTTMAKFSVTLLPSGARRLFLQTPGCLDPPAPAFYLASHRELSGARQRFWACISLGFLTCLELTRDI